MMPPPRSRPAEAVGRAVRGALPLLLWLWAALAAGAGAASAPAPEQERQRLVDYFAQRFPGVPLQDYVYGAMIANPDAKRQYEQIMEFPPFMGDVEQGKKIWDTPFRNGKTFADCFPDGARNVAGHYPYFDPARGKVVTFEMALERLPPRQWRG